MRIRTALASLFLISAIASEAEITMPSFFNDNMVLQQNSAVTFRGTAKPNAKVTVETSWNNKKVSTKSDENGNWDSSKSQYGMYVSRGKDYEK